LYYRSFVWLYIKKENDFAKCDFCNTKLVYQDGTTSNLRKHLKQHKNKVPELKELDVKNKQVTALSRDFDGFKRYLLDNA